MNDLAKLEKMLAQSKEVVERDIAIELSATVDDGLRILKRLTPVDKGQLRKGSYKEKITDLEHKLGNSVEHAPFVEFGTGKYAIIPSELKELAAKFKGSTSEKWDNGLEEIKEWCKRKGIPEEAAYPIFISILKNGIEAQPFLYPAYKLTKKVLQKRMEKYIKNFKLDD